jgi:microcystin-dependent protein
MAVDQFLGEIKLVGFNFAPIEWAMCAGQILSIQQNSALFALLGTMYGGNGTTNFGLPDLQGRAAGHVGPSLYTQQGA